MAASLFHKQWSVSVARAAVGAFTAERRVPDLLAENTVLILDRMGRPTGASLRTPRLAVLAGDPDAAHPECVVVADEAALRDWLRARVIDGHLSGAVDAMAALGLLTEEQLWGNVAAACAGALAVLSNRWGPIDELVAEAAELLDVPGAPTRGLARLVPDEHGGSVKLHVRRETCCLHHCLPADPPPCSSCPLLDEEERVRRRQAHVGELAPVRGPPRVDQDPAPVGVQGLLVGVGGLGQELRRVLAPTPAPPGPLRAAPPGAAPSVTAPTGRCSRSSGDP